MNNTAHYSRLKVHLQSRINVKHTVLVAHAFSLLHSMFGIIMIFSEFQCNLHKLVTALPLVISLSIRAHWVNRLLFSRSPFCRCFHHLTHFFLHSTLFKAAWWLKLEKNGFKIALGVSALQMNWQRTAQGFPAVGTISGKKKKKKKVHQLC